MPSHSHTYSRPNGSRIVSQDNSISHFTLNNAHTTGNYNTGNSGSNTGHNNMQPYITCYMWKRMA